MNIQEKTILVRMIKALESIPLPPIIFGDAITNTQVVIGTINYQSDIRKAIPLLRKIIEGLTSPTQDTEIAMDLISLERIANTANTLFRTDAWDYEDTSDRDRQVGFKHPILHKGYLEQDRWVSVCEHCGVSAASDGHHSLIHRKKGVRELDLPYNIMWVCHKCHMSDGTLNSWDFKVKFWGTQCKRYGEIEMIKWLEGVPLKIKPKFEVINGVNKI